MTNSLRIQFNNYTKFGIKTRDKNGILLANNMNLYLSISKDGGHSYGYESMAPLGQVGQRTFRTVFRKLGVIPRGQPWVIKTEFYAPYPLAILGAAWCVEVLPE